MTPTPCPIFIIGSYRSGTSVLTWCLGQHPNILLLEETNWIYRIGIDLELLYRTGTTNQQYSHIGSIGISNKNFYKYFGNVVNEFIMNHKSDFYRKSISVAIDKLAPEEKETILQKKLSLEELFEHLAPKNYCLFKSINDPKTRWVDGTPENSHHVYGLHRLFPKAKFIHILRDPIRVAHSLMNFSAVGQRDYPEEEAFNTWLRLVNDCKNAEEALGPGKVLRVNQEDLENNRKDLIQRCFNFIGETPSDDCLLPLNKKINSSNCKVAAFSDFKHNLDYDKPYVKNALKLYNTLQNQDFKKPIISSYRKIKLKFIDTVSHLRPENIEALAKWGNDLSNKLHEKDLEIIKLKTELQKTIKPVILCEYGPTTIYASREFNRQSNGESALWIETENATQSTVLVFNNVHLTSSVQNDGKQVTALCPKEIYQFPGEYYIYLLDLETKIKSNSLKITILEDGHK